MMTAAKTIEANGIAVSYVRFSTPSQAQGNSFERQTDRAAAYCERKGLTLDDSLTLRDLGVSAFKGKNLDATSALGGFLAAVGKGKIAKGTTMIVESLDRLSRMQIESALQTFLSIINSGIIIVTLSPEQEFAKGRLDMTALIVALTVMSRANEESNSKSERVSAAWLKKQRKASETQTPMTSKCPSWLRLADDRKHFEVIASAATIIRRVFDMAINGCGMSLIAQKFNQEQVKPLGYADRWHVSMIAGILTNRTVLGEYQPKTAHSKQNAGEPIKGYYPNVITEDIYYKAQQGIQARLKTRGRRKDGIINNLFTGIVKDARDNASMVLKLRTSKKRALNSYLVSAKAIDKVKGSKFLAIPYSGFEQLMLTWLHEIKPLDLVDGAPVNDISEQLTTAETELAKVNERIAKAKQRMMTDDNFDSLLDMVAELDKQKATLTSEVNKLTVENRNQQDDNLTDTQSTIELLSKETGEKLNDLRRRLRAMLAALITEISVMIETKGLERQATVNIQFRSGATRTIAFTVKLGVFSKVQVLSSSLWIPQLRLSHRRLSITKR